MYVNILMKLIENKESTPNRILLEGVIKLHWKSCNKSGGSCPCGILAKDHCKNYYHTKLNQ